MVNDSVANYWNYFKFDGYLRSDSANNVGYKILCKKDNQRN